MICENDLSRIDIANKKILSNKNRYISHSIMLNEPCSTLQGCNCELNETCLWLLRDIMRKSTNENKISFHKKSSLQSHGRYNKKYKLYMYMVIFSIKLQKIGNSIDTICNKSQNLLWLNLYTKQVLYTAINLQNIIYYYLFFLFFYFLYRFLTAIRT